MEPSSLHPSSRIMDRVDDYTRREPKKAILSALGLGALLPMLPLGAIAVSLAGIAFSLARPTLLTLGLIKASELCGFQSHTPSHHE